ncbi:MAG: hypothetical protein IPL61_33165 [Myxococcales bacterium]|nr:hypothetical protein [Myxococcales bacterium]
MKWIAIAALGASACLGPPDNDLIQWSDDFERCDLCNWVTVGDVRRVTTYHPGEHALALAPGARAGQSFGIARGADEYSDGNWVELSTDCVGPGALTLRALPGPDKRLALDLELDDVALGPFARHWLNLPPVDPDVPVTFAELTITAGAVPCRVDNLQIRISGGTYAY